MCDRVKFSLCAVAKTRETELSSLLSETMQEQQKQRSELEEIKEGFKKHACLDSLILLDIIGRSAPFGLVGKYIDADWI